MRVQRPAARWRKLRFLTIVVFCLLPQVGAAHDAFGDLGPFYASLLHPLADPLQASLLLGIAAFIAQQKLSFSRVAMPLFVSAASLAALTLISASPLVAPPLAVSLIVLVTGGAAMLPEAVKPRFVAFALVVVAGFVTGLAPGSLAETSVLQALLGTVCGIAALVLMAWYALETMARRLSSLAPKIAGSWVAAIGILVAAFSI